MRPEEERVRHAEEEQWHGHEKGTQRRDRELPPDVAAKHVRRPLQVLTPAVVAREQPHEAVAELGIVFEREEQQDWHERGRRHEPDDGADLPCEAHHEGRGFERPPHGSGRAGTS